MPWLLSNSLFYQNVWIEIEAINGGNPMPNSREEYIKSTWIFEREKV